MSIKDEKLILEIDGPEVPAEKFEKGIRSFLNILKDVSQSVSGSKTGVKWTVEVKPACIRMNFKAKAEAKYFDDVPVIFDTVENGIKSLEEKKPRPRWFSDNAARHARSLASIISSNGDGIETVKVWRNGNANTISYNTIATVNALSKTRYKDHGSLVGKLSVISEKGRLKFFIVDPITKRDIRCNFEEDKIGDVLEAFRCRIEVCGLIKYRKDGSPISIDAEEFFVFPDSDDLPKPREVRGILRGVS